jgi:hypothetical protein
MPDLSERDYLKRLSGGAVSAGAIAEHLRDPRARKYHAVRRALAAHARTPRAEALALIPTLFWRDLAWISSEARVPPQVRRAADREILRRLPGLALSEKTEIASLAGRGVVAALRTETEPALLHAILRNRFTTEADVVSIAVRSRDGALLEEIGADAAWGRRIGVRAALALNPATPLSQLRLLLPEIPLEDLRTLCSDRTRAAKVRDAARREYRFRVEEAPRVD